MHTSARSFFAQIVAGVFIFAPLAVAQDKPAPPAAPKPVETPGVQPAAAPGKPITKPSGLVIEDIAVGTGAEVKRGNWFVVHHICMNKSSGDEFQNTYRSGKAEGLALREGKNGVVKGWVEGIPGMKVGGKRRLTVPAALAYGDQEFKEGAKVVIPANSDLIYEIELVDILIVEDIQVGTGLECKPGGAVVANYKGTFKSDGRELDSSEKHGGPMAFSLNRVIRGWTEGLPGMKIGGKRKLTIPYAFAYGDAGRPPRIPGKSDLVFEIELVNVLEIVDEKVGEGAEVPVPTPGAPAPTVKVNYRGTLKEGGREFDSSYKRNEPISFALDGVINGWQWGIPGMKVGGKRKLIIPWQMAYGERGSPPDIGPKADLVFEVELLEVK
ncbi:MAG: FKBP-type peptidyl-prolyl cis-trans isomerase [Pyrinomonadaceae bacterium]|nr:FKBP-type peptidyl-prolyl cis-trans isomerase [Phycisphaerales bacterium]